MNKPDEIHLEILKKDEIINDLKNQLEEERFVNKTTKEYLFVLEHDIRKKNKQITSLKKENKQFKEHYNQILSSNSWKITKPIRALKHYLKKP